ncbi:MAG: RHS repeat domain-containing protein [Pseudomonadota bacterium]
MPILRAACITEDAMRQTRLLVLLAAATLALGALGANAAERVTYFAPDALGSPAAAMDEQGNVLWRETYAPYGERQTKSPENPASPAYTGKPEDPDTGLVYMGARMYDPETARFTGLDPQQFKDSDPHTFGRYVYANNSPYRYVDPNGESAAEGSVLILVDLVQMGIAASNGDPLGPPAVALGLDVVGAAIPIPGAGPALKTGRVVNGAASAADKGPVIIGETMGRVEAAASKIPNAKILNDMPDFRASGKSADQVTSAMMQHNRKWILEQIRSGRPILDIGRDPNRGKPSIFYDMEQQMIKNYRKLHPEWSKLEKQ